MVFLTLVWRTAGHYSKRTNHNWFHRAAGKLHLKTTESMPYLHTMCQLIHTGTRHHNGACHHWLASMQQEFSWVKDISSSCKGKGSTTFEFRHHHPGRSASGNSLLTMWWCDVWLEEWKPATVSLDGSQSCPEPASVRNVFWGVVTNPNG